jgi:hypothetical protein
MVDKVVHNRFSTHCYRLAVLVLGNVFAFEDNFSIQDNEMKVSKAVHVSLVVSASLWPKDACAVPLAQGLLDPAEQELFSNAVPNALDPGFIYHIPANGKITVAACENAGHEVGLKSNGTVVTAPVWGYADTADGICTWPGRTFQVSSNKTTTVTWVNNIAYYALLTGKDSMQGHSVLDTTYHWAYSLDNCTIDNNIEACGGQNSLVIYGIPIVTHLHAGFSDSVRCNYL